MQRLPLDSCFVASYYRHANGARCHEMSQLMSIYYNAAALGRADKMEDAKRKLTTILVQIEEIEANGRNSN